MFVTPGAKVSFSRYGYLWLYMLRSFYAIDIVRETDSTYYGGTSLEFHWGTESVKDTFWRNFASKLSLQLA